MYFTCYLLLPTFLRHINFIHLFILCTLLKVADRRLDFLDSAKPEAQKFFLGSNHPI